MHRTDSTPKRSNYPFTVILILLVHLGLGYALYQKAAQPEKGIDGTEQKAFHQQEIPAIP